MSDTKRVYFNANRVFQATAMQPWLRKIHLESKVERLGCKEYTLLLRLAAKMAFKDGTGKSKTLKDTCFPSTKTLAEETFLCERSVRSAVENLIEAGVITKSAIRVPGRCKMNRYHVVPEVWDCYGTIFDAQGEKSKPRAAKPKAHSGPELEEIVSLLRQAVPEHNAWVSDRDDVAGGVRTCLARTQEPRKCVDIFKAKLEDTKIKASLASSTNLPAYIVKSFEGWRAAA